MENKSRKVGMIGVISNPVKSVNSHNGGWTYVCKSILEDYFKTEIDVLNENNDWKAYDTLLINEGVNYKSSVYNFFGGVSEKTISRLLKLKDFKGDLFSINEKVDYNDMCNKRKELIGFRNLNFQIPNILDVSKLSNSLILGDSHSLSVFKPGYCVSRNDGKTLHGFLKEGIKSYIDSSVSKLVFYAGNIDIRFHICRYGIDSLDYMILDLERQLKELNMNDISLVELLPIENESRKIPGTGKYDGNNFNGSREQRLEIVLHFNKMLNIIAKNNNWNVLKWNFDYEKELSFNDMEAKQSVHLRPTSYMFANDFINVETKKLL
jgi:hypothetical protein